MSGDDPLAAAVSDWQRKHRIADGDPMIAALELVRIYLHHAREVDSTQAALPPSFEDFRGTIELLDRRSRSFVQQVTDVVGELRRLGQSVERLNRSRFLVQLVLVGMGILLGMLIGRPL